MRHYGADFYHSEHWPTEDRIIPWKLFYMFLDAMGRTEAAEKLRIAQAVAHGYSMAMNGKDAKIKNHTRRLTNFAYPEVRDGT